MTTSRYAARHHARPVAWAVAWLLATAPASVHAQPARRAAPRVPMDSARAAQLYVSNRHEDHPQRNHEEDIRRKAEMDSTFRA
ncbi:MAG TPA: hypothetical protein VIL18_08980, partial [Longimicrobiales bacterium]